MRPGNSTIRYVIILVILTLWVFLFNYCLAADQQLLMWIVVALAPVIVLLAYLLFDPEIFLYALIFFVPLSLKLDIPGGYSVSFPSEALALLMLAYLIIHFDSIRIPDKRIFSHPIFIVLVVEVIWLTISSVFSTILLVSFKRTIITFLYIAVFYFFFLTKFDKPANILRFFLFYALGIIIPVINGMHWHSQYNFSQPSSYYMPLPFFAEHAIYGAALAFILIPLFYLAFIPNDYNKSILRRIVFISLFFFCLIAEFLSYSRAAWLSLLVALVFFVIFKLKIKVVYLFAAFVITITLIFINLERVFYLMSRNDASSNRGNLKEQVQSVSNIKSDMSNLERINRWKCAIRMFKERPLTGFGPGTYQFKYAPYQLRNELTRISTFHGDRGNAHSEYLGYLCETGFPGFLIYMAAVFLTIMTAIRIIYQTNNKMVRNLAFIILLALITFYVHTIFNGFLENDEIGSLYYGSLAAITAIDVYYFKKKE
jgi:putative inorganic carbon (HCO3(-)) transporter